MTKRPIIGVPTQTLEEIPGELPRCWVMSQQYIRVLVQAGAVPWIIPLLSGDTTTLREIYDRLDGVFLPGGVDLHPSSYHEQPTAHCGRTDPDRDETELDPDSLGDGGQEAAAGRLPGGPGRQRGRGRLGASGPRVGAAGVHQARLLPQPGSVHARHAGARGHASPPTPASAGWSVGRRFG